MREICHLQAGQCGNQIGAKVIHIYIIYIPIRLLNMSIFVDHNLNSQLHKRKSYFLIPIEV